MKSDVTQILAELTSGNRDRTDELFQLLYEGRSVGTLSVSLDDTTGEPLDDMVLHQVVKGIIPTAVEQGIRD